MIDLELVCWGGNLWRNKAFCWFGLKFWTKEKCTFERIRIFTFKKRWGEVKEKGREVEEIHIW